MSTPSVSPPVLPPELITAIIYEVDDVESLKVCSLVASSLRSRCQRILYSTLTIRMDNCAALCKLLAESSHIADYVTNLVIRTLYPTMREPDLENFRQILVKVRNVRRCTLDGQWNRFPMHVPIGHPVVPPVDIPPLVLDFLVRQPLRYLSLSCVRIPTSMLGRFLTTVPELSFSSDSVAVQDGVPPTAVQTPVLHSLFLSSTVKDVGPYVVQPQNMRCLCALRHLSFQTPGNGWAAELIQAASRTLQHLHFSCREHPPLNLPCLPALRTLQLTFTVELSFRASDGFRTTTARPAVISQTTNVLSSLVFPETLPALAEVQIEQFFADNGIFDPTPYISLIALLEASLASYSTPPRIRWFLVMYDQDAQYTDFVDAVRRGMPKADSEGRLIMEACAIVASRGKLNKRFRI